MTISIATKGIISLHIAGDVTVVVEGEVRGAYSGDQQDNHAHSADQDPTGAFVKDC